MANIADTIARLSALRNYGASPLLQQGAGRLTPMTDFGPNPGDLRAHVYIPENLPARAPLVVVLHGCTQTAAGYDIGSGWSQMADRHGFALLFPEQQRQNNPNLCFNWFAPADSRRDSGEALSIRQMIASFAGRHTIDQDRVFVTGLSAGGAMASVMLATYPEVFAGGAIIAGLAYGCAASVPQALDRMRGHGLPEAAKLEARVRGASRHKGPWPTVSIWQGTRDTTVNPVNADALIDQWRALHGVSLDPDQVENLGQHQRHAWRGADGREVIEHYTITGMGHGTPLDTVGKDGCGQAGPFMLEAGISSTQAICRFWGLSAPGAEIRIESAVPASAPVDVQADQVEPAENVEPAQLLAPRRLQPEPHGRKPATAPTSVRKVIEDALRAAGLMR